MNREEANKILEANFAPWVLALNLKVEETTPTTALLRLPWSPTLAREGGAMSGQALLAAADTATVIAISAARGGYVPMTTVQLSTTFERPVIDADVLIRAEVTKHGRTLAFATITMTAQGADAPSAHASTVYALLG